MSVCPTCGSTISGDVLSDHEDVAEVMVRIGVTRSPAILFLMLWQAQGRIVTYAAFLDVHRSMTGRDPGHHYAVATVKKRLAKALQPHPVEIKAEYGLGYRLRLLAPDWDWRTLPIT